MIASEVSVTGSESTRVEAECACKKPEVRQDWGKFVKQTIGTYLQEHVDDDGTPDGHMIRGTCRDCFSDLGYKRILKPETHQ
jgi:hypothetical protein